MSTQLSVSGKSTEAFGERFRRLVSIRGDKTLVSVIVGLVLVVLVIPPLWFLVEGSVVFTDDAGRFHFRSVKPAGYPIPIDGPVGDLVHATRRHHYRPAHLHFMIYKPGFKTMVSQIYAPDDAHIDSDVQFGVTRALIGDYVRHDEPSAEHGFAAPWYSLDRHFVLEPGEARRPAAPIRSKAAV